MDPSGGDVRSPRGCASSGSCWLCLLRPVLVTAPELRPRLLVPALLGTGLLPGAGGPPVLMELTARGCSLRTGLVSCGAGPDCVSASAWPWGRLHVARWFKGSGTQRGTAGVTGCVLAGEEGVEGGPGEGSGRPSAFCRPCSGCQCNAVPGRGAGRTWTSSGGCIRVISSALGLERRWVLTQCPVCVVPVFSSPPAGPLAAAWSSGVRALGGSGAVFQRIASRSRFRGRPPEASPAEGGHVALGRRVLHAVPFPREI